MPFSTAPFRYAAFGSNALRTESRLRVHTDATSCRSARSARDISISRQFIIAVYWQIVSMNPDIAASRGPICVTMTTLLKATRRKQSTITFKCPPVEIQGGCFH